MKRSCARLLAAVLFGTLGADAASAVDLSAAGFVRQTFEASDNIGFEDGGDAGFASTTDLGVSFLANGQRYNLRVSPGVRFRYQSDEDVAFEDVAPRLNLTGTLLGRRRQLSVTFNFVPEPVSETRFENGATTTSSTLELRGSGSLNYSYFATPRDTFTTSLFGNFNEYVGDTDQDRNRQVGLSGTWSRIATPRTTLSLSPSVRRFTSDSDTSRDGIEYSLVAGSNHRFSDALSASATAGLSVVAFESGGGQASEVSPGFVGSIGASYAATRDTTFRFNLSQSVDQSDGGEIQNRLSGALGVTHRINTRSAVSLSGSVGVENELLGGTQNAQTVQISPTYSYEFTRDWSMRVGYRFRFRSDEDDDESIYANTMFLTVSRNISVLP